MSLPRADRCRTATEASSWATSSARRLPECGFTMAVAVTTSAVPVVCAAGPFDRDVIDELRSTLLTCRHHCAGSAIICDLSRSQILDPAPVTRLLAEVARRATQGSGRLLVLPATGLPCRPRPPSSTCGAAVAAFVVLDDMDAGLRMTAGAELERDDRQVRRMLDRTIRHGLRELRCQPPYVTLDPATCQAVRWRLADAARAGANAGPRLLAAAAGVRTALTFLSAGQYQDAYFALLTAEDHLAGRAEPPSAVSAHPNLPRADPPRADKRPGPPERATGGSAPAEEMGAGLTRGATSGGTAAAWILSASRHLVTSRHPREALNRHAGLKG
jgi:hypothetical protein